jgi:hypothetical protein
MGRILDYGDALRSLYDDQQWILRGTDSLSGLEWSGPKPRPSQQELDTEVARLQAEYDSKEYQRLREPEYPPIKDQLDTLFHGGIDAWRAEIQAVKDKYPKP